MLRCHLFKNDGNNSVVLFRAIVSSCKKALFFYQ